MQSFRFSILFFCCSLLACGTNSKIDISSDPQFPQAYFGKWSGTLEVLKNNAVVNQIKMSLRIAPSTKDTIDWIISYDDGISKDMREYTLIEQNKDKGLYIIDEQNGILLPAQLTGNTLTSIFSVKSNLLNASYQLEGDHILFSIQVVNLEDSKNTGDSIIGSEVIPPVEVFPLQAVQLARLKRVK